jgi:hypothetical protein
MDIFFLILISFMIPLDPLLLEVFKVYGPFFSLGAILSVTNSSLDIRKNLLTISVALLLSGRTLMARMANVEGLWSHEAIALSLLIICLVAVYFSNRVTLKTPRYLRLASTIGVFSMMTYPMYLLHETAGLGLISYLFHRFSNLLLAYSITSFLIILVSWLLVSFIEPFARSALKNLIWHA